jgi:hypothetical protein
MARKLLVVPLLLIFIFCFFSLTTEFLDVQRVMVKERMAQANIDLPLPTMAPSNGSQVTVTAPMPSSRHEREAENFVHSHSSVSTLIQNAATSTATTQSFEAALPNKRTADTITVPTTATSPAPVSRKSISTQNVHAYNNVSTLIQNKTTTATTATRKVIKWEGQDDMVWKVSQYKFCEKMQERNETQRQTLLNITFGCQELFTKSISGTGNWISAIYALRLAASVLGDVDVQMTCTDAVNEQTSLILPWLMGSFPVRGGASHVVSDQRDVDTTSSGGIRGSGRGSGSANSNTVQMPTIEEACSVYNDCPFGHMLPDMRYELRRMAVALVGVPHENHPAAAFAERFLWNPKNNNDNNDSAFSDNTMQLSVPARGEPPLIPGVVLDDVVLNFRGGDLLDNTHPGYGFMKFSAFSKRIPPNTKSIGIVTQPFENSGAQQRRQERSSTTRGRHRVVVMALVDFLKEKFPQARVTIHNGSTETIALAYARMVMANQTIAGISTFGVFPAIASFGTGYIFKPFGKRLRGPNQFLMNPPIDQLADNVILIEEPNLLMVKTARAMFRKPAGQDLVLEWFKNDTFWASLHGCDSTKEFCVDCNSTTYY